MVTVAAGKTTEFVLSAESLHCESFGSFRYFLGALPIIIIGGFLSIATIYVAFRLLRLPVSVVDLSTFYADANAAVMIRG